MDVAFVIVGITGDLAKRKVLPALYHLIKDKKIGKIKIYGVGTRETTEKIILREAKKYIEKPQKIAWKQLEQSLTYVRGDVTKEDVYKELKEQIILGGCKNTLYYLATLPRFFEPIVAHLKTQGLHQSKGWTRILFEKPFGDTLHDAKSLNKSIRKVFHETQIYRVDHYLGKELVQNLSMLRFTNEVLEPMWHKKHVDHVQIIASETLGVEERGKFYDAYGATKDVLQNHLLQLLALTAMDVPKAFHATMIRNKKAAVLKKTKIIRTQYGQYKGYKKEKGVSPSSNTETLVAAEARINTKRWKNVPFYLKTGKHMKEKQTIIALQFKNSSCHLFDGFCPTRPNQLIYSIHPEEKLSLTLNARGREETVQEVIMEYTHPQQLGKNTPEAYENIFIHALQGDQSLFVRSDEVEASWKIVHPLVHKRKALSVYNKGEDPTADFIKNGHWLA